LLSAAAAVEAPITKHEELEQKTADQAAAPHRYIKKVRHFTMEALAYNLPVQVQASETMAETGMLLVMQEAEEEQLPAAAQVSQVQGINFL